MLRARLNKRSQFYIYIYIEYIAARYSERDGDRRPSYVAQHYRSIHPVHMPNLVVDGACGPVTQGRIRYVYVRRNVPSICAYVYTRDALAAFPPTREFNTTLASRSIAGYRTIVFREGRVSLFSTKLTKGGSRRARFTRCAQSERNVR